MRRHNMPPYVVLVLIFAFIPAVVLQESEGKTDSLRAKYPLKNDRIAIVGAGPSGIHMAYKLKRLGYSDITIFERTDRVGGKSYTYRHKGTRQEFGSVFTTTQYTELMKLLREFGTGNIVSIGSTASWINPQNYFVNGTYPLYAVAAETGTTDPQAAKAFLLNAVQKYVMLHRKMFQTYEGELFPRPNAEVLHLTRGTFLEYLQRNNIEILKSIFITSHTIQGYGHLDEISALYGLMWNTPEFLLGLVKNPSATVGVIDTGYQPLWEEMAKKEKLKIIFKSGIKSIRRNNRDVRITYGDHYRRPSIKTERFDFLILAAHLKHLFRFTVKDEDEDKRDRNIFNKATPEFYTVTLIDSFYYRRSPAPSNFLISEAYSKIDHVVWLNMDSYALLTGQNGEEYMNGTLPDNHLGQFIQSGMYYQIGKSYPSTRVLNKKIEKFASDFQMKLYVVKKRKTWEYFPRYSPEDMSSGILWDILDLQGYKRTWYIGSSVSFESIKSVLEYNNLLLRKFNLV